MLPSLAGKTASSSIGTDQGDAWAATCCLHHVADPLDRNTGNLFRHAAARGSGKKKFIILAAMQCLIQRSFRVYRQQGRVDLGGDAGLFA